MSQPSVPIKTSIDLLKKIQVFDRESYLNQEALNNFPAQIAAVKQEFEKEKNRLMDLENALKKAQLNLKEKEGQLATKEANVKKLDGQLGQVKTNKEYSALQQEIASLKADNSILEEQIIKLMDEVEAANHEVKTERERLKQVEKEYLAKENQIAQDGKAFEQSIQNLKKQRDEIIGQIPEDIRSLYDLVIQKKQGIALARINGENCGACQIKLRPQILNQVLLAEELIVCENCSRILYFEIA
ncbi:MAG TPA: C4-type zinc ribbon domain-containing protein [Candidatus Omnitrophota bacterium]|nr:C4-type zinc ribbon domain-containing protein [Candidatus Omnitrophota bacterium]